MSGQIKPENVMPSPAECTSVTTSGAQIEQREHYEVHVSRAELDSNVLPAYVHDIHGRGKLTIREFEVDEDVTERRTLVTVICHQLNRNGERVVSQNSQIFQQQQSAVPEV